MASSFWAELLVLRKWPAAWVLVGLVAFLKFFFDYVFQYVLYLTANTGTLSDLSPELLLPALLPEQFVTVAVSGFDLYGAATAIVLGSLVAGSDWSRGTLKTALSQRPTKLQTYSGQALAVFSFLAVGDLAVLAVAAGSAWAISLLEAGAAAPEAASWPAMLMVAKGVGVTLLISVTYGSLGLALGSLFRSAGLAIGVALLLSVIVQGFLGTLALQVGGVIKTIDNALPGANARTLRLTFGAPGGGPDTQVLLPNDPTSAVWLLIGYSVLFLALGALLLWRRDVA